MYRFLFLLTAAFTIVSCGDNNGKENERILSSSSGNINNLSVIVENELWQGQIGEAIREVLAAPVDGLPQEEPLFSINQMPPEAFSGFTRKNRLFLKVEKGNPADIKVGNDMFAKPQTGVVISGETNEEIAALIAENAPNIIKAFKQTEITEKQRRISKSLKDDAKLKEKMGVSLKFPDAYRYAKEEDDFVWIRKDITSGSMEILIYEVPIHTIQKDSNIVGNIIKMRDSIGETHIPGRLDGHMITEDAYAPYLFDSKIDGKFAYETKGTWEVTNDFMGGPFLNYAVLDEENNRFLILEGFAFAPSAQKRDYMFELEAILKSAKIN